ncbi:hypothetical protein ACHQM5_025464 [Ranunculus cassubicifolius]
MPESKGGGFTAKLRFSVLLFIFVSITLSALYSLYTPIPNNGCTMTYMYPTYIPINLSTSLKYNLYLYHEGWRKIDFSDHLKNLNGVPLLFLPGNGGSYKQVRSLAAESDRAYQGGPLDPTFYQQPDEDSPQTYTRRLDWFAVDLEDEHSAMDGQIVQEQTQYVVYAIHRILELYKESHDARSREGTATSESLPKSVILVGHSMGGFVARAAIVHPHLRRGVVKTVLTLSSPHQSPPLPLQPSLGRYFHLVNQEWRRGYEVEFTDTRHELSKPTLSDVIVISICGGVRDYQVRSKLESLDGIVPSSNRLVIGSTGMKNVWLSMEHQTILWCNQLVVQISHTLLSLIDPNNGQPFTTTQKRLTVFTKMLRSEIPPSFGWARQVHTSSLSTNVQFQEGKRAAGSRAHTFSLCPQSVHWNDDGLERDLYIHGSTVTVLAMDGRRRWLDIQKSGSDGKNHFVLVTNLGPCSGVRLHLWPDKRKGTSDGSPRERVVEVTSRMVEIPAGPAPMQLEPGSQTEQAPPSAVFQLGPDDMHGFRFLTISVAPRPTVSGRPPPAASMAVGQFFNPEDGITEFSPGSMLSSVYARQEILLKEDHPLVLNLSFSISLGLLPVTLSLETTGCGIKSSGLPIEESGDADHRKLCKLRCFPPVAIAWDSTSGLHIFPNLNSETIAVDSSPALLESTTESDTTTVLLLVDPHCSFKIEASISLTDAAGRYLLLYNSEIVGLSIAVIFFALMRQARAWELDMPLPSLLSSVVMNSRMPQSFLLLALLPIFVSLFFRMLISHPIPPLLSLFTVSTICYAFANGFMIILILISQSFFYMAAYMHAFIKTRCQLSEEKFPFTFLHRLLNLFCSLFSFKALRIVKCNPAVATSLVSVVLVCFVHPALGLFTLLVSHAFHCHTALSSYLAASFRSLARKRNCSSVSKSGSDSLFPNSPNSTRSYVDTQIETFNHMHSILILHLLAALMFLPSLVAWFQRVGVGQRIPWVSDSGLCVGVILHGLFGSKPEHNFVSFPLLHVQGERVGLSLIYLVAGFFCYSSGLALAPYRAFYAMASVGVISTALRILERRYKEKSESYFSATRKHFHRH